MFISKPLVDFVLTDSPIKPAGGLGVRFAKLLPFLEKDFNCRVFCNGVGGYVSETPCFSLTTGGAVHGCSPALMWTDQVLEYFAKDDGPRIPDVVIAADYAAIIAAKALARACGSKFVVEFNLAYFSLSKTLNEKELTPELRNFGNLMVNIEKLGSLASDLVVSCSEFYKRELPWQVKRSVAIPNGINIEEWTDDKKHKPFVFPGGYKRNLVYIGRMNALKGIRELLDFQVQASVGRIVKIPEKDCLPLPPDTALHFVGGPVAGEQYPAVIETCKGNPQKFHIPFVSGQDKIDLLRSCDGVIFPSKHEPFGIVGLEAMAAKAPLITTASGGIGDYATQDNSIRCENTVESIREAIEQLRNLSSEKHTTLVDAGFATAKKYSWASASEIYERELTKLL